MNLLFAGLFLTAAALFVVVKAMRGGVNSLITTTGVVGGLIWVVAGRKVWWFPIIIATSIGGLIWVGFRIYTHEISLIIAAIALFPAIAINYRSMEQYRGPLSWMAYALMIYVIAHLGASLILNRYSAETGYGNITRTYMGAIWPLLFVLGMHHYGDASRMRLAINIIYIGLIARVLFGLYLYFFPGLVFFRGFNAFFVLSESSSTELRRTALHLAIIALGFVATAHRLPQKVFHLTITVLAAWLVLMGAARTAVAMLGVIPLFWLLVLRKYTWIFLMLCAMSAIVVFFNLHPEIIYLFPKGPQRALTILIFGDVLDIQAKLAGSDLWHAVLFDEGKRRWLTSPLTFLFGNRVHRFDMNVGGYWADFFYTVKVAANTARYESGLWTVLATTGLVGAALYVATFFTLLRDSVRILFRERITDLNHLIYFVAASHALLYFLFAPVSGGFPGVELMWAGLACITYRDERIRKEKLRLESEGVPNRPATLIIR